MARGEVTGLELFGCAWVLQLVFLGGCLVQDSRFLNVGFSG